MDSAPTTTDSNKRNKSASIATTCVVCLHARRDEFDKALALDQMTPAQVAREIGCHRSSVSRHKKNHLLPVMAEQVKADPELAELDILAELKKLFRSMRTNLDMAEKTDNWQAIRGFHSEARQDLELLAKLLGDLDTRPQINIWITPEWQAISATIILALSPFPDAKIAVASALVELENKR